MRPVRLVVHSDYLCPWCHVAAHRLERLAAEEGVELAWRSFLLRPVPETRDRDAFVRYTRSWRRFAGEPDAPPFRPWEEGEGARSAPSHSVPPHVVARAAARVGPAAFAAIHPRLLRATFEERRDVTDPATLRAIWAEAGLPEEAFAHPDDPALREEILAEHREALALGITGVPAVRPEGHDAFVLGAQPLATWRRWIGRLREGVLERDAGEA